MRVLVFNCGSSSLKYSVLEMPDEREIARGEAQRVGPPTAQPSRIVHRQHGTVRTMLAEMPDHAAAFVEVMRVLEQSDVPSPQAIAHRIVHGGKLFPENLTLDASAEHALNEIVDLAPIHNPPAVALVGACRERASELPQVLVFDTSYHSTIPEQAATYALPEALRVELGLRKYGFHGISHGYVIAEAAALLGRPRAELNAVSCHLGSGGASLCAVKGGRSIDNTMGYTPLQGLIMSTRCGDLDPAVTLQLLARRGGDVARVESQLNQHSGVLGMSEYSADIRDVARAATPDDPYRSLAVDVYLWRIRKYLGAYLTTAAPVQAIVFTDTIGETVPMVRAAACSGLEPFGVVLDAAANHRLTELPSDIAAAVSTVRILVVATNEELAIAREGYALLGDLKPSPAAESAT